MLFEDFLSFDTTALITIIILIFINYLSLNLYLKHRKETVLAIIISFIGILFSLYSISVNLPLTPSLQILFFFINFCTLCLTIGRGFD